MKKKKKRKKSRRIKLLFCVKNFNFLGNRYNYDIIKIWFDKQDIISNNINNATSSSILFIWIIMDLLKNDVLENILICLNICLNKKYYANQKIIINI